MGEESVCPVCVCLSVHLQVQLFSRPCPTSHPSQGGVNIILIFISCVCVCVCVCVRAHTHTRAPVQSLSRVRLFATTWTDCTPPVSSVHGIFQARILDWAAISYSRESPQARDGSCDAGVFCIGRQILYHCATWETPIPSLLAANVMAGTESNYISVVGRCSLVSKPFILL